MKCQEVKTIMETDGQRESRALMNFVLMAFLRSLGEE